MIFALFWIFVGSTLGALAMAFALAGKGVDEWCRGYRRGYDEATAARKDQGSW